VSYKRIFLDANIINDIHDSDRSEHRYSVEVLSYAIMNDIELYTSCDIATNVYYITSKYIGKDDALEAIEDIITQFHIIPFGKKELLATTKLMKSDSDYADLEDTIQYTLALQQTCDLIISNDKRFVSKEIELMSSREFFERVVEE
jgi:predicted nucleic acid-binding protein